MPHLQHSRRPPRSLSCQLQRRISPAACCTLVLQSLIWRTLSMRPMVLKVLEASMQRAGHLQHCWRPPCRTLPVLRMQRAACLARTFLHRRQAECASPLELDSRAVLQRQLPLLLLQLRKCSTLGSLPTLWQRLHRSKLGIRCWAAMSQVR